MLDFGKSGLMGNMSCVMNADLIVIKMTRFDLIMMVGEKTGPIHLFWNRDDGVKSTNHPISWFIVYYSGWISFVLIDSCRSVKNLPAIHADWSIGPIGDNRSGNVSFPLDSNEFTLDCMSQVWTNHHWTMLWSVHRFLPCNFLVILLSMKRWHESRVFVGFELLHVAVINKGICWCVYLKLDHWDISLNRKADVNAIHLLIVVRKSATNLIIWVSIVVTRKRQLRRWSKGGGHRQVNLMQLNWIKIFGLNVSKVFIAMEKEIGSLKFGTTLWSLFFL